jgi:nicotinate-nucleotide--dimethylbenzimidazole phosphoribosyltransferase
VTWFHDALADLTDPDVDAATAVAERARTVLRPVGALQRLDDVAVHVAAWQGISRPAITRPAVLVFAGDHGVARAGVSAYPDDVTASMLAAVRAGRATINAMARIVGAMLEVHDVGVGAPTGDIRVEPAMSPERFDEIARLAAEAVDGVVERGADLLVVGELGIGNTTVSAALPAALLGGDVAAWVGRGTGVDDDGMERKRAAVAAAVERIGSPTDPLETMRELGGSELTAMAAAVLRARHHRLPVVLDGYVATAAVLPLHLAVPGALDHCLVGHASAEPGHRRILDRLGAEPLLDLALCLGEGSGALAAVPLVQIACACVTEVPTFDEWFGDEWFGDEWFGDESFGEAT